MSSLLNQHPAQHHLSRVRSIPLRDLPLNQWGTWQQGPHSIIGKNVSRSFIGGTTVAENMYFLFEGPHTVRTLASTNNRILYLVSVKRALLQLTLYTRSFGGL